MFNSAKALATGIKADFFKLLTKLPESYFKPLIYTGKSNKDKEKYWIPNALPEILEWIDNISFSDFQDFQLTVRNKRYARGILIGRDYLSDTKGTIGNQVEAFIKYLGQKYVSFPDKLCQALLAANSNAFDSTAFFSTSRANIDTGSNTINNLYSGTLSGSYTTSTFSADFNGAEQALLGFKDKSDEPFNEAAELVVLIPTHLKNIANQILSEKALTYIDAGTSVQTSNIYSGMAKIMINYRQGSSDNDWYIINTKNPFGPFVIQDREGAKWEYKDDNEVLDLKYWLTFRMGYEFLNPMSIIKINN